MGTAPPALVESEPAFARVLTFSDAVFAFAITLMVLAIRVPHPTDADVASGLLTLLTDQWPAYLAFVLSFFWVGLAWVNHRVIFSKLIRTDHVLIWINLLFLMLIALLPIPTAVLGQWISSSSREDQLTAVLFYGAVTTAEGLVFNLLWWYAAYWGKLTTSQLTEAVRHAHTKAWAPAPLLAVGVTLLGFIEPRLTFAGFLVVGIAYVLPVPRLVMAAYRSRGIQRPRS